jgi:hypothetical protein
LSLEFGGWLDDDDLLAAAQRFLVRLLRSSEAVDPEADVFEPELADVAYDDDAFRDVIADLDRAGLLDNEEPA